MGANASPKKSWPTISGYQINKSHNVAPQFFLA